MTYVKFEDGQYMATGERPSNQSWVNTLIKLKKRLKKTLKVNKDLTLTEIQNKFDKIINTYNVKMKKNLEKLEQYKNKFLDCIKKFGLKILPTNKCKALITFFKKNKNRQDVKKKIFKYVKDNIKKTIEIFHFKNIKEVFKDLKKYDAKVEKYKKKVKKRPELKENGIDIAHGIAIKKIIDNFVDILNEGENLRRGKKIKKCYLDVISTDNVLDKEDMEEFIDDVKEGETSSKELVIRANAIIEKLNACTKNLSPGHASLNRSIKDAWDVFLMEKKSDKNSVTVVPHAEKNHDNFIKATGKAYKAKTTDNGKKVKSSSIETAYSVKTYKKSKK